MPDAVGAGPGGGLVVMAERVGGRPLIRPPHSDLVNAVGAATAPAMERTVKVAVAPGADPGTSTILSKSDVPLDVPHPISPMTE